MPMLRLANGEFKHEKCGYSHISKTDNFCGGCGEDISYFKNQFIQHEERIKNLLRAQSKDTE